jgi:hypothetical protein
MGISDVSDKPIHMRRINDFSESGQLRRVALQGFRASAPLKVRRLGRRYMDVPLAVSKEQGT